MILVTGSTGFVGTSLCRELTRRSLPFLPVSRTARPGSAIIDDIGPATDWTAALRDVDTVIHLAARVHIMQDSAADPLACFRRTNVDGTLALARQFASTGGKRFIFVSSIKVNGEATLPGIAFTAGDMPAPMDPYGQSKSEAEAELFALGRETGLEVVVIRPPLVYGPGVKANFASMIKWVRRGIPLPFGSVGNARSLLYVENLVDLLIVATTHPAAPGRVFLASDDHDVSTSQLLMEIGEAAGVPARLLRVPTALLLALARALGKGPVANRLLCNLQVDIADTRKDLGWSPPVDFKDAMAATLRHVVGRSSRS